MTSSRPVLWSAICMTALLWAGAPADSPVADAAMRGEAETVRTLLREGADVNAAQGDGMTALHWAAERGDAGLVDVLLYAGANVGAVTRLGDYTPLHLAAKAGRAQVLEPLIAAGSDVHAVTATGGVTALHFASASSSTGAVTVLLRLGAAVNARETRWGQTPLMFAAAFNRVDAIRVLLEHGADVAALSKVLDLRAQSQADRAAGQRRDQTLEAFRAEQPESQIGWRPTARQVQDAVEAAQEGKSVLTVAVDADSVDFEEATPGAMSYVDLVGAEGGLTALLHAVREGHVDAAMALLDAEADVNQVSGSDQTSPMLIALINGHFDLALQLLQRGADPTLASAAGTTPLYSALNTHWAPKARYPQQQAYQQQDATYLEVMKAMLDAGGDPNARLEKHLWYMGYTFDLLRVDTKGATPFWRAAYATDVPAMELLLAYGADPALATERVPGRQRRGPAREDPSGLPPVAVGEPAVYPIHAASGVGYGEGYAGNAHRHVPDGWIPAVRFLIEEHGADVNARDLNGYTALHHAAARGDNDLIRYLVSKGGDVTVVSRRGQTTVDMANGPVQRIQPFPETIALLESLGAINNHNCVSC